MENSNSREYLEKITSAVIDNLRQTGPAPSVQMQDVPRKPFGGMTDEEEAELDDLDEDENKDVRMTEHRWDKAVENGAEFEASDDEDMSAANGATRRNGNKRGFINYEKEDVASENGGKSASPKDKQEDGSKEIADPESHDVNDDTIEDVGTTEEQEKDAEQEAEQEEKDKSESKKQQVDADGDVGMEDSAPTEDAAIKQEEAEPEAATETDQADKPAEDKPAEKEPSEPTVEKDTAEPKAEEPATEEKADTAESKEKEVTSTEAMEVDEDKEKEKKEDKAEVASAE